MSLLTMAALTSRGYDLNAPFELQLQIDGRTRTLRCVEVLRWLPGRRLVAVVQAVDSPSPAAATAATREAAEPTGLDQQVLKLFLGSDARRYFRREQQGLGWLRDAGLKVPTELSAVSSSDGALGCLFSYLGAAKPLSVADRDGMNLLVSSFAKLHDQGIWHEDPKLDNFLRDADGLWFVDGDAVRRQGSPLIRRAGLDSLAQLLAELPLGGRSISGRSPETTRLDSEWLSASANQWVQLYAQARGWTHTDLLQLRADRALKRTRHRRLARYLRKTHRECGEFTRLESDRFSGIRVRDLPEHIWQPLFNDPDAVMAQAQIVKAGNSATVVRWQPPLGASLIVKRYNVKSSIHAWRRALRPLPRYRRAWQYGHGLRLFGIATARPLMLIERRQRWPRGEAWLVMEDLGDHQLADSEQHEDTRTLNEIAELMHMLRALGLAHGDTKASNFLRHANVWHLLDLDAMTYSPPGWRRDQRRLMENFPPSVAAQLSKLLASS